MLGFWIFPSSLCFQLRDTLTAFVCKEGNCTFWNEIQADSIKATA